MRVHGEQTGAAQYRGALVGELGEVLVVALLLPLGDLDQVAALVVRRGQLHTLARELRVKVPANTESNMWRCLAKTMISPCVRIIDDLRLERRCYPLLLQVSPVNAVEKRVRLDRPGINSHKTH